MAGTTETSCRATHGVGDPFDRTARERDAGNGARSDSAPSRGTVFVSTNRGYRKFPVTGSTQSGPYLMHGGDLFNRPAQERGTSTGLSCSIRLTEVGFASRCRPWIE